MEDCVEEQLLKYAELAAQEGTKTIQQFICYNWSIADQDSSSAIEMLTQILISAFKIYFVIENFLFSLFFPNS